MYQITVLSPPSVPPIAASELRDRLRLNDSTEDSALAEFLAAAVDLFEHDTDRPVLQTTYRQDFATWPVNFFPVTSYALVNPIAVAWPGAIVLGRGGVTSVAAVRQYQADGSTVDLASSAWRADLLTPPARINLSTIPAPIVTSTGIPVTPVGCIEFTAGWPNPSAVPATVRTALMLLAGHWFRNREAWREGKLEELPDGWDRVVRRFKLGIEGPWGQ